MEILESFFPFSHFYHFSSGVLTELCDAKDACALDARIFKGIFMRNLRYLMDASTKEFQPKIKEYQSFIESNVKALLSQATCYPHHSNDCHIVYLDGPPAFNKTGPVFGASWNLPFHEARPIAQNSALDLLNSAIFAKIQCQGNLCSFDPPNPPPAKLTCKDQPCPTGQDCCPSYDSYYSCCAPDQKCQDNYCI